MASRTVAKSAITITNPNAIPVVKPASATTAAESTNGSTNGTTTNGNGTTQEAPQTPAPSAAQAVMSPGTPSAAQHPSAGVAPVAEASRPSAPKPPTQAWSSLDMGGVNIKHLPLNSGVFTYTFLTALYLNHNQLSTVPGAIGRLRQLELLDLSGNQLTTLPAELGMLTTLRELYVFDNSISVLPHELGTLHQLSTLGVEGNPLDAMQMKLIQKDGTSALIAYLRDSCPPPAPPPERTWTQLISPAEREAIEADPNMETFSVLSYNILWEKAATERMYGYTPQWALAWDYRKELILTEVMNYNADFLCLQEVDITQYEDYFVPALSQEGVDYEGVYWPRSRFKTMSDADRRVVDGCATFFKKSK
jgi:CCR4-NOT transcription complex subunit 6